MMTFEYASRSATGLVRKENEDTVFADSSSGVFAVADGMGGGDEGALASRMVAGALSRMVTAKRYHDRLDQIRQAVSAANSEITACISERGLRQMGSTVALLAFDTEVAARAAIAYVGDSRVYRLRTGRAELLTRDHSVGAELEDRVGGGFSARANPLAHVLTRVIGMASKVEIEWRKVDVLPRDRFLVCTDGVHDVLEIGELPPLIGSGDIADVADILCDEIVRRGAPDNYSFVIIEIGGEA